jgi:hypothetical protein
MPKYVTLKCPDFGLLRSTLSSGTGTCEKIKKGAVAFENGLSYLKTMVNGGTKTVRSTVATTGNMGPVDWAWNPQPPHSLIE